MSNPLAPALVPILEALAQFVTNLGTDPAQIAAKFPGALAVFLGNVEMQIPGLAATELATLQGDVNAKIAAWIKSLQA